MARRRNNANKGAVSFSDDYWISFSDMMTGLIMIIILIAAGVIYVYHSKLDSYENNEVVPKKELIAAQREIQELKKELEELKIVNNALKEDISKLNRELAIYKNYNYDQLLKRNEELEKELSRVRDNITKPINVIQKLLANIDTRLKERGVYGVQVDERNLTLHVRNQIIEFRQGDYQIPKVSKEKIKIISQVLNEEIANLGLDVKYLDTILIEGHTDQKPYFNRAIKGNWGLSALRAISFWDELKYNSKTLDNYTNLDNNKLFSVSGYAESRPDYCSKRGHKFNPNLCSNFNRNLSEKESDNLDRRIDIRFTPKFDKD